LLQLRSVSTLILSSISYFTYLRHTHPSGLSHIQDLTKHCPIEVSLPPNGSIDAGIVADAAGDADGMAVAINNHNADLKYAIGIGHCQWHTQRYSRSHGCSKVVSPWWDFLFQILWWHGKTHQEAVPLDKIGLTISYSCLTP
jgi:hypothetical protein